MSTTARSQIEQLRHQLVGHQAQHSDRTFLSTGLRSLDALLPHHGLPSGALIEFVNDDDGFRSTTIAIKCAVPFLRRPGALAIVDPLSQFHSAPLEGFGISLDRVMMVRPVKGASATFSALSQRQRSDSLWAIEQLARCSGVQVLLTWVDRISSTAQRRLQLAVEQSGVTVFMIRPHSALRQTSWADLRFHVESDTNQAAHRDQCGRSTSTLSTVRLIRSKNAVQHSGVARLECHHEAGVVSEISELARSASATTTAS